MSQSRRGAPRQRGSKPRLVAQVADPAFAAISDNGKEAPR